VPVDVELAICTRNRQDPLGTSDTGKAAQSADHLKLDIGAPRDALDLVAVTPKLPAVPVVADKVTLFTARIYLPDAAAGIKPLSGCMKEARRVAASETPVKFPVVPSL
jgi:hypothetical protein